MSDLPLPGDELVIDTTKCLSGGELLRAHGDMVRLVVTDARKGPVPSISATILGTDESVMLPWDEIGPGVQQGP